MDYKIGIYTENYLDDICEIWNEAIDEGLTLHWTEHIPQGKVEYIISTQIECICAVSNNKCVGFYVLHPNSSDPRRSLHRQAVQESACVNPP